MYGLYVVTLCCSFAVASTRSKAVELLATFAIAWSITFYCALDARAHRKVFVRTFWYATFIAWPVAPLFHLLRTRGKKGALMFGFHALLLLFCILTSGAIGSLVK